jgi:MMPL family
MNRLGAWRSLVARTVRVGEVPGSNPGAPICSSSAPTREHRPRRPAVIGLARSVFSPSRVPALVVGLMSNVRLRYPQMGCRVDVRAMPTESYVPMIIFAIVFGLSMDYEVFLISRIREHWFAHSRQPLQRRCRPWGDRAGDPCASAQRSPPSLNAAWIPPSTQPSAEHPRLKTQSPSTSRASGSTRPMRQSAPS